MQITPRALLRLLDRHLEENPGEEKDFIARGRPYPKQVRAMTTEAIVARLASLGVTFDEAGFVDDLKRTGSAEAVSDEWAARGGKPSAPFGPEFLLIAALELHRRLAWEVVTVETIDDLMAEGYAKAIEANSISAAAPPWLRAWEHLRKRLPAGPVPFAEADRIVGGLHPVGEWCIHLIDALGHSALSDEGVHGRRASLAGELRAAFDAEPKAGLRFLLAEADSLACLGRMDEAGALFRDVVARFPRSAAVRVALGDFHWRYRASAKDHAAAEAAYRAALDEPGLDVPAFAHARLVELYRETGRAADAEREQRCLPRREGDRDPPNTRREGDQVVVEEENLPPLADLIRKELGRVDIEGQEEEHSFLLMPLELGVLERYRNNRSLRNSHVLQALKEVRDRLPHPPAGEFARDLYGRLHAVAALHPQMLSDALIRGCLDRLTESVKFHGGKQGYLLFLSRTMNLG